MTSFIVPLIAIAAGFVLLGWALYKFGYNRGLMRSRQLEERIDGPIVWDEIARVRAEMKGWMV